MAYTFDDDDPLPSVTDDPYADIVAQAAAESAATPEGRAMAEIDRNAEAQTRAAEATAAANARAVGIANRDQNVYNPDRPSTWKAPDSPKVTTLDRAQAIKPDAAATSMARRARAEALGGNVAVDDAAELSAVGLRSLAAQQKARGLQPGEVPAEEIAAMRAQAANAAFDESYNRLGGRVVSSPNRAYPSTMKAVGAMLGDNSVSQAIGPDGQPMFRTEMVDEPIIGADGQPMLDPLNPSGPPLMRQVEKQVPVMQRNTGLLGGQREAAMRVQEAELDREMVNTSLLQEQALKQHELHKAMEASALARRQHAEGVRKTIDDANKAIISASSAYEKADDVDPDRGWGEKGVAAKISAVIAAGLLGFAGMDPFAHINAVINNSIDAQKANIAKRGQAVEHARGRHAAAVAAHEQIRAQIGDEEMQDEAIRISALEAIKSEALAKLQNAGVKVRTAEQAAFMNGLDQQLAEHRGMLELKAATTPATVSRTVYQGSPAQRELDKMRAKSALNIIESSGDKGLDVIAKRQEQGRDVQGKIDVDAQAGSKPNPENLRMIAKETATANRVRSLAADLLADIKANNGDVPGVGSVYVPGVGAPTHQLTRDARDFRRRLDLLNQYDITDLTGAVSSPEQMDVINRFTSGDESAITSGLTEVIRSMDAHINTIEGADPEAAAAIREHTRKGLGGWRGGREDAGASRYTKSESVEEDR